jgi:hypothetical protein
MQARKDSVPGCTSRLCWPSWAWQAAGGGGVLPPSKTLNAGQLQLPTLQVCAERT